MFTPVVFTRTSSNYVSSSLPVFALVVVKFSLVFQRTTFCLVEFVSSFNARAGTCHLLCRYSSLPVMCLVIYLSLENSSKLL